MEIFIVAEGDSLLKDLKAKQIYLSEVLKLETYFLNARLFTSNQGKHCIDCSSEKSVNSSRGKKVSKYKEA